MSDQSMLVGLLRNALEGDEDGWMSAVKNTAVPVLVDALAEVHASSESQNLVLLAALVREAVRTRGALRGRVNKEINEARGRTSPRLTALEWMASIIESVAPELATIERDLELLDKRVAHGCEALRVPPLLARGIIEKSIDGDILPTNIQVTDLPTLSVADAEALASRLKQRAMGGRTTNPSVQARLYLAALKALLAQPNPQDLERDVMYHLSGYCRARSEVLGEDTQQLEAAEDYALGAIRYQQATHDFPPLLLFRACLRRYGRDTGRTLPRFSKAYEAFHVVLESGDRVAASYVMLAMFRFAEINKGWAWTSSGLGSLGHRADFFFSAVAPSLPGGELVSELSQRDQFSALLDTYIVNKQELTSLLKRAAASPPTVQGIAAQYEPLCRIERKTRGISRAADADTIRSLCAVANDVRQMTESRDPAEARVLLHHANSELNMACTRHAETELAVMASALVPAWGAGIAAGLEQAAAQLKPQLTLRLVRRTYLREGGKRVVQLEVFNEGVGTALGVVIRADFSDGQLEGELDRATIPPGEESAATLYFPEGDEHEGLEFNWRLQCTDSEGNSFAFESAESLVVSAAPHDIDFSDLRLKNPFSPGDVVTDAKMFFGRDQLLSRLSNAVIESDNSGAMRILYGQRRVGKSSVLHFLKQRLELIEERTVIPVLISWLSYPSHTPAQVVYEIAKQLQRAAKARGVSVAAPRLSSFEENYSFQFNELLDRLEDRFDEPRFVFLVDEFDKAYYQFSSPEYDYGEPFYNYLRGLSMRPNSSLILAGGEELPQFLKDLGPAFNNARRERASYLSREDTCDLVRNEHVSWLHFDDRAVERVFGLTQGNPFFTQMLCKSLVDNACAMHSIDVSRADVDKTAGVLVSDEIGPEAMAHLYTLGQTVNALDLAVLYCLAQDAESAMENPWVEERRLSNRVAASDAELKKSLTSLTEREVLAGKDSPIRWRIVMPLFSAWFRQRCPLSEGAWALLERGNDD